MGQILKSKNTNLSLPTPHPHPTKIRPKYSQRVVRVSHSAEGHCGHFSYRIQAEISTKPVRN